MNLRSKVRDRTAMLHGEWQPLGPEFGKVEVNVRAMGGAYHDALAAGRRDLLREFGNHEAVPSDREGDMITECLIQHVLVDVRGSATDNIDGQPVSLPAFLELMREPGGALIVNAVVAAAQRVGFRKEADRKAAVGNSQPPSATPSPSAALQTTG